jgi:hypothetical protein
MDFYYKVVDAKKLELSFECLVCFPLFFCLSFVIIRNNNKQNIVKDGTKMKTQIKGIDFKE